MAMDLPRRSGGRGSRADRSRAVSWVRQHYHPDAVEMPWQAWWVRRIQPLNT